jgi:hypothetical protein
MSAGGSGFPAGALNGVDASVIQEVIDQAGFWLNGKPHGSSPLSSRRSRSIRIFGWMKL